MPLFAIWGLLGIAGLGAAGYFVHETGHAIDETGQATAHTADSIVKIVTVSAIALYALHETGVLKGSIKL